MVLEIHVYLFIAFQLNIRDSENCNSEINYAKSIKKDIIYVLYEKIKGEEERMEKLGVIGFHIARKSF